MSMNVAPALPRLKYIVAFFEPQIFEHAKIVPPKKIFGIK